MVFKLVAGTKSIRTISRFRLSTIELCTFLLITLLTVTLVSTSEIRIKTIRTISRLRLLSVEFYTSLRTSVSIVDYSGDCSVHCQPCFHQCNEDHNDYYFLMLTLFIPALFEWCSTRRGVFRLHPVTPLSLKSNDSNFVQNYFGVRSTFCGSKNWDQIENDVTMTSSLF